MSFASRVVPLFGAAPYLGPVATRAYVPNNRGGTGVLQSMSRTRHIAREAVSSIQVQYANWMVSTPSSSGGAQTGLETTQGLAGNQSMTLGLEKDGVFYQGHTTAGGAVTSSVASGNNHSFTVNVSLSPGDVFFLRPFVDGVADNHKLMYHGMTGATAPAAGPVDPANGECYETAASGLSDRSMSGSISAATLTIQYPCAILGMTRKPTFAFVADSRVWGVHDTADTTGDVGDFARTIGAKYAYINMGIPSDRAQWVKASNTKRAALAALCSHTFCNLGINDLGSGGRTSAQLLADLALVWAAFPGRPLYQATLEPFTTGAWTLADGSDQTAFTNNAARNTVNTTIRAVAAGMTGFLEVSLAYQNAGSSAKWKAPGWTTDGIHGEQLAYTFLRDSGLIPATWTR